MSTKLPRLNVVLDPQMMDAIQKLAKRENSSMSLIAKDLLREALSIYEDTYWAKEATSREKTFSKKRALSQTDVWKQF